jgi:hypothetical protein
MTRLRTGRSGDRIPRERRIFLFSKTAQTAPGAHPASYSIGTGVLPGLKLLERDTDHSPPSSSQVKNEWSCTSTPPICPHCMDRDEFNLYTYCLPLYRTAQAVCYSNAQYSTVQYSIGKYTTVQYSTIHYSTLWYSSQHSTLQYNRHSTLQYNTQHYGTVHSTTHYSTIHYSTIRYNTLQYTKVNTLSKLRHSSQHSTL